MQERSGIQNPVPRDGVLDRAHLNAAAMGDPALAAEVLALFKTQAEEIAAALAGEPPNAGALTHTLKGSARSVGAWDVAKAAEALEAVLRAGGRHAEAVAEVAKQVERVRAAVVAAQS